MSEAIWYFADGDEERGPVTEAQIRALVGTGNLKRDDLVWKEGMEDWTPAEEVPGLFGKEPAAPPVESPARGATPSEKRKVEPESAKRPERAPVERARVTNVSFDFSKAIDRFKSIGSPGLPLFVAGFMLVLLSKGCDSMATRYVARIKAKSQVTESRFQNDWNRQRSAIETRRQKLLDKGNPTPDDRQELNSLGQELEDLNEEKQEEIEELRQGEWQDLAIAADDAEANNDMWAFWREGFFWFGTLVFSFGLMTVGFTGKGAYRWMCLIMLAIIVFSLYVGRA